MAAKIIPFPSEEEDPEEYITITVFGEDYHIKRKYHGKFFALVDSLLKHLEKKSAGIV